MQIPEHHHRRIDIVAGYNDFSDDGDDPGNGGSGGPGNGGPGGPGASGPPSGLGAGLPGAAMGGMLPGGPGGTGGDDDEAVAKSMLVDYNEKFAGADPALYRDAVIDRVNAALISKNKPSVIMLGPAGVGKTRVVEEIARRIANDDPSVPARLREKTIYELSLTSMVAGTMYRGQMEEKLQALIRWASDPGNGAVLFIDEVHQLVPSNGHGSGSHEEVAQALKPALARGELSVIGATTDQEGRSLLSDPAFMRRFTRVGVSELNQAQTEEVLRAALPGLLTHYDQLVSVDDGLLESVVALADEHLRTLHRPDSALTLLDRTMAKVVVDKHKPIMANVPAPLALSRSLFRETAEGMHGSDAVARGLDVAALTAGLSRIKGQDPVCAQVVENLRRDAAGLFPRVRPLAWMFAGPSGVGKTEVARQIARVIMGTEPIVLNMSEFPEPSSVTRITGSSPGYVGSDSNKELPFDPLDANPRQVIVLDEFEKAHQEVQRLMLSALDTGQMKTAMGKTIDFSKALIIATTNAGRDAMAAHSRGLGFSNQKIGSARTMDKAELTKALTSQGPGQPGFERELLGRFTWLVAFSAISAEVYREVLVESYARQREQVFAANPFMAGKLPEQLPDDVVDQLGRSYVADLGARPAEWVVRGWIEQTCFS